MMKYGLGFASVENGGKWGFIDASDCLVIPFEFDGAWDFQDGRAVVARKDKRGFIDKNGREVIPCKYDGVRDFHEGVAIVGKIFRTVLPKSAIVRLVTTDRE